MQGAAPGLPLRYPLPGLPGPCAVGRGAVASVCTRPLHCPPFSRPRVLPGPPATSGLAPPLHGGVTEKGPQAQQRLSRRGLPPPTGACPALGSPRPHLQSRCAHRCLGLLQAMWFQGSEHLGSRGPGACCGSGRELCVAVSPAQLAPNPAGRGAARPLLPRCALLPGTPHTPQAGSPLPHGARSSDSCPAGGPPAGALPRWLWRVLRARRTLSGPPSCFPSASRPWSESQTQRPPGLRVAGLARRPASVRGARRLAPAQCVRVRPTCNRGVAASS